MKPYITAGRKHRLKYPELFDVSNVEADGSILDPESARGQANKVFRCQAHVFVHSNANYRVQLGK